MWVSVISLDVKLNYTIRNRILRFANCPGDFTPQGELRLIFSSRLLLNIRHRSIENELEIKEAPTGRWELRAGHIQQLTSWYSGAPKAFAPTDC